MRTLTATLLLLSLLVASAVLADAPVPLVAAYEATKSTLAHVVITDAGPSGTDGVARGVQIIDLPETPQDPARATQPHGKALQLAGKDAVIELPAAVSERLMKSFTLTTWIRIDQPQKRDGQLIFWKGGNSGVQLGISADYRLYIHGFSGEWFYRTMGNAPPVGQWAHLAFCGQFPGAMTVYLDGKPLGTLKVEGVLSPVDDPWRLGNGEWNGCLEHIHVYGTALDEAQVLADMHGALPVKAVRVQELPESTFGIKANLTRFDMPRGNADFDQLTRQPACKQPGPDAIDWPTLTLRRDGMAPVELFKDSATQFFETKKPGGAENGAISRQPGDSAIAPLDCWVRPVAWLWGQFYIYGGGPGFRSSAAGFEIWGYPVRIASPTPGGIHTVALEYGGQHYQRQGELNSLTLILPQNPTTWHYALTVNGQHPLSFDVGLQPLEFGNPRNLPLRIDVKIPGTDITVQSLAKPESFPNPNEWANDLKNVTADHATPDRPVTAAADTMAGRLGIETPRSPVSINLCFQRFGMSHNFFFAGEAKRPLDDYVALLEELGFDRDIEPVLESGFNAEHPQYAAWLNALSKAGLQGMLNPAGDMLAHANMGLFGATIPECNAPARREVQLLAERFHECPAFAGLVIGGDNGGYVSFWHWAPPHPNRPWLRAMEVLLAGQQPQIPLPPSAGRHTSLDSQGSMREFQQYIAHYDAAFAFSYRHFAEALAEIDPRLVYTTGSFGSSPGVVARGGYPIGSIPGKEMHQGLAVQLAYDWNEMGSSLPLHNVALIDRLRSYFPEKETWATIDDFGILLGREARQRAYALALTRGIKAIGTTWLTLPDGSGFINDDKGSYGTEPLDQQRELFAWIHRFGGPYAMMQPDASIGILYVQEQAVARRCDAPDPEGPHEGKTTEALFLCHQAGWPARIVTPEELQRGLPASMKALLLTGLNQFDGDWRWSAGLERALAKFVAGGGRIMLDHESVCPVAAVKTDMRICAYAQQSDKDISPLLLERNQENARKLNIAMAGMPAPLATGSDTAWAIPSRAGDVRYVTVVNWQPRPFPDGASDGTRRREGVNPQVATLLWHADGPIYDLREGKALTLAQASFCDLTKDAFRLYALPPREPKAPTITVRYGADGWAYASVHVAGMTGIPVELELARAEDRATLFSASGLEIKLPVRAGDRPGTVTVLVTELLSGKASKSSFAVKTAAHPAPAGPVSFHDAAAIRAFMARKAPLAIALTRAQQADPEIAGLAGRLREIAARAGRTAVLKVIEPGDFVVSLQEMKPSAYVGPAFPQWRTEPDDVLLLGSPKDNLLLYDELRGGLLPAGSLTLAPGATAIGYAWSPFVYGCHAVNLLAADKAGLTAAVDALARLF